MAHTTINFIALLGLVLLSACNSGHVTVGLDDASDENRKPQTGPADELASSESTDSYDTPADRAIMAGQELFEEVSADGDYRASTKYSESDDSGPPGTLRAVLHIDGPNGYSHELDGNGAPVARAFSPDGKFLVFQDIVTYGGLEIPSLFGFELATKRVQQLTNTDATIAQLGIDEQNRRIVSIPIRRCPMRWDGHAFIFTVPRDGTYRVDLDTGEVLTSAPNPEACEQQGASHGQE